MLSRGGGVITAGRLLAAGGLINCWEFLQGSGGLTAQTCVGRTGPAAAKPALVVWKLGCLEGREPHTTRTGAGGKHFLAGKQWRWGIRGKRLIGIQRRHG